MKGIVASTFAALSLAFEPTSPPDIAKYEAYSWAFDKRYEFSFTEEMLRKSPAWKEDAESPPLSAGRATEMKDSLVKDSDEFKWKLTRVQLMPLDNGRWFWCVEFDALRVGAFVGSGDNRLGIIVLMDGTVVKPTITDG